MQDRPTVLVLGAHGRFGGAAVQAFAAAGWRVLAQARRAPSSRAASVEPLAIPLADTDALVRAAAGARAVVYAVNPIYTRWDTEMLPLARLGRRPTLIRSLSAVAGLGSIGLGLAWGLPYARHWLM